MKKLVLLLTLACVSVVFARPNVYSNVVFGGSFGSGNSFSAQELGEDENGIMQYAAAGNYIFSGSGDNWGGWANSDSSMYPIIMENGATITFTAALISTNAASTDLNVKFERLPYNAEGNEAADTEPSYTSDSVTISGTGTNTYIITVPAQAGLTFSSFLLYDAATAAGLYPSTVYITNFILEGLEDNDTTPPSPSATTFATAPTTTGDSSITMTATTATDDNGVLYKFECTTDSAFSSDWQTSETYEATGLTSATEYTFTVQARDNSYDENFATVSAAASATTTGADTTPPSPSTTTATLEASAVTIEITAVASTDSSGVEYNFVSVGDAGPNSGWQTSNVYVATGLDQGTEYTYVVQARDGAGTPNLTVATTNAATTATVTEDDIDDALTGFSGTSTDGSTIHALALSGLEVVNSEAGRNLTFDSNGVSFAGVGDTGRNILRTIANDFDTLDFVYEVSVIFSDIAQNAFIGAGDGALGDFGVPDWNLQYAGLVSELKADGNTYQTLVNNNVTGGAWSDAIGLGVLSNNTTRVQMTHDSSAETFTIAIDEEYNGTFSADHTAPVVAYDDIWDPSYGPLQDPNYAVDEVVYVLNGQFDTEPDPAWEQSQGGGAGATYSFTNGYARIDSTAGAWAVMVAADANGEMKTAPADIAASAGDMVTVTMDMIEFSNGNPGVNTAGIKIESWDENNTMVGSSGDMKLQVADVWTTYTWTYRIDPAAAYIKVVPVQHDEISVGYDNIGFIPNTSASADATTFTRLFVGGDDGVVFKDMSITVSGGSVVVDPFSISSISSITGGSVITWTAQSDVTYEVQYKTSLVGGTWETTVSSVTGDGSVSATSAVDAASAFFRVIGQ